MGNHGPRKGTYEALFLKTHPPVHEVGPWVNSLCLAVPSHACAINVKLPVAPGNKRRIRPRFCIALTNGCRASRAHINRLGKDTGASKRGKQRADRQRFHHTSLRQLKTTNEIRCSQGERWSVEANEYTNIGPDLRSYPLSFCYKAGIAQTSAFDPKRTCAREH